MKNRVLFSLKVSFRVTILTISSLTLLLLLLSGCNSSSSQKNKPNILFIAVDDLRPELGCYGSTAIKSPNIDKLAGEGMVFTRAYCQSAVCNPSRASLLTGMRPDSIRVWDLRTDFRDNVPDIVTLPQYFKQNGYESVAIGKIYHNNIPDTLSWSEPKMYLDDYPFDPDAVYRDEKILEEIEKRKEAILKAGKEKRYIDRFGKWYIKQYATEGPDVPDNAYFDGAQTDAAIQKLKELKEGEKPFFFAIGYYRPHLPFNVPKKYWDMYDRNKIPLADNQFIPKNAPLMAINNLRELRSYTDFKQAKHPAYGSLTEEQARLLRHGYFASVSYVDAQIGRLMDSMEKMGLRDNTIVILWGDHGWKLGEHNSWCKMTNYEIDTRVPLIISTPDMKNTGKQSAALVEFVDIYPSLCELAGLPLPSDLQGTSFVPLLDNPDRPWKKAVFSQFLREGVWIAPDGIEYMGYSIRTDRFRYVEWINWETKELAAKELYDHETDPQENENIVDNLQYAGYVQTLAGQLKAGWRKAIPAQD